MHIIVAPDSYKGSLSAVGVAAAMTKGIHHIFADAIVTEAPIADGGEGTVDALVQSTGGEYRSRRVTGPLGNFVEARWGILGDGETGVVEVAAASGLHLVSEAEKNPLIATSYGTGELIRTALEEGVKRLIIGLGGSATNDGGTGIAQALGVRFLDEQGQELPRGGGALIRLHHVDVTHLHPELAEVEILLASDVDNPLCGRAGASAVYGPQKGASPEDVDHLDAALSHYATIVQNATGRDIANTPGAGAAGGIGAGLMFFTRAKICSGIDFILDAIRFDEKVRQADLVLTGEGSTNYQTAYGKAPVGVAAIAARYGVPTLCVSGGLGERYEEIFRTGIRAAQSVVPGPMTLEACMANAEELIEKGTANILRVLKMGIEMNQTI